MSLQVRHFRRGEITAIQILISISISHFRVLSMHPKRFENISERLTFYKFTWYEFANDTWQNGIWYNLPDPVSWQWNLTPFRWRLAVEPNVLNSPHPLPASRFHGARDRGGSSQVITPRVRQLRSIKLTTREMANCVRQPDATAAKVTPIMQLNGTSSFGTEIVFPKFQFFWNTIFLNRIRVKHLLHQFIKNLNAMSQLQ